MEFNKNHNGINQAFPAPVQSGGTSPQVNMSRLFQQANLGIMRGQYPQFNAYFPINNGGSGNSLFRGTSPGMLSSPTPRASMFSPVPIPSQQQQIRQLQHGSPPIFQVSPQQMNSHPVIHRLPGPNVMQQQPNADGRFIVLRRRADMEVGYRPAGPSLEVQRVQHMLYSNYMSPRPLQTNVSSSANPPLFNHSADIYRPMMLADGPKINNASSPPQAQLPKYQGELRPPFPFPSTGANKTPKRKQSNCDQPIEISSCSVTIQKESSFVSITKGSKRNSASSSDSEAKPKRRKVSKKKVAFQKPEVPEIRHVKSENPVKESETILTAMERLNEPPHGGAKTVKNGRGTNPTPIASCGMKADSVNPDVALVSSQAKVQQKKDWDVEYEKAQNAIVDAILAKGVDCVEKGIETFRYEVRQSRCNPYEVGLRLIQNDMKLISAKCVSPKVRFTLGSENPSTRSMLTLYVCVKEGEIYSGYPPIKVQVSCEYPAELPVFVGLNQASSVITNPERKMRFEIAVNLFRRQLIKLDLVANPLYAMIRMWVSIFKHIVSTPRNKLLLTAAAAKKKLVTCNEILASHIPI